MTVIGVTGERLADADDIGELCFEHSDQLVLTTDNPLGVNQEDLFMALTSKLPLNSNKASACIEDRLLAIKVAVTEIQSGDVLLLCGKGHEKYQYITSNKNDAKPYVGDLDALKIAVEAIGLQVVSGLAESEEPADLTVK